MDPIEAKKRQLEEQAKRRASRAAGAEHAGSDETAEAPRAGPAPSADEMECPQCAETIKKKAKLCRFCRCDLSAPLSPAPSASAPGTVSKPDAASGVATPTLASPGSTDGDRLRQERLAAGMKECLLCGGFFMPDPESQTSCTACETPETFRVPAKRTGRGPVGKSASVIKEYSCDTATAVKAAAAAVSHLGYTVQSVDQANGLVKFETGVSWSSWAGQSMSVHVMSVGRRVQVSIGGTMKAHGAQVQVVDWGEAAKIAHTVFGRLDATLGPGVLIAQPATSSAGMVLFVIVCGVIALMVALLLVLPPG